MECIFCGYFAAVNVLYKCQIFCNMFFTKNIKIKGDLHCSFSAWQTNYSKQKMFKKVFIFLIKLCNNYKNLNELFVARAQKYALNIQVNVIL